MSELPKDPDESRRGWNASMDAAASVKAALNHRHGKAIHSHPERTGSKHAHGGDLGAEATWDVEPLLGFVYSPLVMDDEK